MFHNNIKQIWENHMLPYSLEAPYRSASTEYHNIYFHYENTPIQIYRKFYYQKNKNF